MHRFARWLCAVCVHSCRESAVCCYCMKSAASKHHTLGLLNDRGNTRSISRGGVQQRKKRRVSSWNPACARILFVVANRQRSYVYLRSFCPDTTILRSYPRSLSTRFHPLFSLLLTLSRPYRMFLSLASRAPVFCSRSTAQWVCLRIYITRIPFGRIKKFSW